MSLDVDPNDRPTLSNRPSRSPTSVSTSSNEPPPLAVMTVRARLRTLWFLPVCQLPPILIVCRSRDCVSDPDRSIVSVGDVVIG